MAANPVSFKLTDDVMAAVDVTPVAQQTPAPGQDRPKMAPSGSPAAGVWDQVAPPSLLDFIT